MDKQIDLFGNETTIEISKNTRSTVKKEDAKQVFRSMNGYTNIGHCQECIHCLEQATKLYKCELIGTKDNMTISPSDRSCLKFRRKGEYCGTK